MSNVRMAHVPHSIVLSLSLIGLVSSESQGAMACEVVQLLANADFDSGSGGGWIEQAQFPLIVPSAELPVAPHSGYYAAWMGGVFDDTTTLYQDVVVPSSAVDLSLEGQIHISTEEIGGSPWDDWTVTLRSTSGVVLEFLGEFTNADATNTWVPFSFAASTGFAGQSIRLQLMSYNDYINNTNFIVDSLALTVGDCSLVFSDGFESGGTSAWSSVVL